MELEFDACIRELGISTIIVEKNQTKTADNTKKNVA